MRIRTLFLLTALSLAAPHVVPAADTAPAQQAQATQFRVDPWLINGLLDPATGAIEREGLRRELLAAANSGNPAALYIAGSLYRQGSAHPARVFDKDLGKAHELLLTAALKGSLPAMSKLAQVEYDAGRYAEAMDWAQVFSYYWRETDEFDETRAAYLKYLLKSISDKLGTGNDEVIRQRTIALLERHGPTIEAALAQSRSESSQAPALRPISLRKPVQKLRRVPLLSKDSGMAEFYIAVDNKGRVAKFWMLDSVPDAAMADTLDGLFRNARFNELDTPDQGYRIGLQSISFSNQKLDLNQR